MNKNQIHDRLFFLEEKLNDYTKDDLQRLSRYLLACISAIIATVGFLYVNKFYELLHRLGLFIYIALFLLAVGIALEFINSYLFGNLTEYAKDIENAKLQGNNSLAKELREKRDGIIIMVDISRKATLVTSIGGLVLFVIVSFIVLNNLLSSYGSSKPAFFNFGRHNYRVYR